MPAAAAGYAGPGSQSADAPVPAPRVGFAVWSLARWSGIDRLIAQQRTRQPDERKGKVLGDAGSVLACISSTASRPGAVGLTLDHLQCLDIQMGFDRRPLQPAVRQFEIPEPLGVRHGHATNLVHQV